MKQNTLTLALGRIFVLICSFMALQSAPALAAPGTQAPQNAAAGAASAQPSPSTLGFRIRNADEESDRPAAAPALASTPLGPTEKKQLLARLPALTQTADDSKDFALRAPSIPVPRTGPTLNASFPPPPASIPTPMGVSAQGPLKVERYAPEGPVEIAPQLSVTFSQPMVPVTALDALAQNKPPVTLTPQPAGTWRWLGTRTLMFQPHTRLPMATEYSVEIPAGTQAVNGQRLAQAVRWTFSTPPPGIKAVWPTQKGPETEIGDSPQGPSSALSVPSAPVRRDPVIFAAFDQAIDPATMLASIELRRGGGGGGGTRTVALRLATQAEIQADPTVANLAQNAPQGRWLAFKPAALLAADTNYEVTIRPGAKGAEGPRTTQKAQHFTFKTFGPFKAVAPSCDSDPACPPFAPVTIRFSNPIDSARFKDSMVTLTPAIPGMKVFANGDRITIRGQTQGRIRYTVTLADTLADRYGQTLGQRATLHFNVGAARPWLFPDNAGSIVLDPAAPKQYIAYSINVPALRVRIYAVAPEDYPAYDQFRGGWQPWPPGRLVFDKVIAPRGVPDAVTATPIDLSPALSSGLGHAIVMVTAADEKTNGRNTVWVQSTQLGLMTYTEFKALTAWVTRLSDGSPVEGARISVLGTRASGASGASDESGTSDTGRDGLVRVPVAAWDSWKNGWEKRFIVATRGADSAIVENYPPLPYGASAADMQNLSRQARWLVYDDRGVYKPGEEVRIKGWIRRAVAGRGGDLAAIANGGGKTLRFLVRDPLGAEISQGKAAIDDQGSFDLAFKLPGNANLGHANIEFDLEQARSNHSFQIQEFRTPEFEVGVKASEGPYFAGSNATATLTAAYYAGGGLASAPVGWRVQRTIATFAPPNHSDYHFGPQARDWWLPPVDGGIQTQTWSARTNAQGIHRIRLDFDTPAPPYPMHLDLHGQVTDVNRQQWSGQTRLLVHPASAYVGVRLEQNFVRAGAAVNLSLIVTGIDGKALSGRPITVRAARVDWVQQGDTFEDKEVDAQTCTATSGSAGADQPARCTFKPMQGGPWRITARVTDAQGRENQTVSTLWVMGEASAKPRALGEDRLTVMADKKEYPPGDTAELLVLAPFAPAEGVLTVRRQGLVHIERFTLHGPTQTLKVKLDESMVPNVQIGVDLVGTASREHSADPAGKKPRQRPAYAHASINVNVLPISRTLTVTATPQALSAEPGAATSIGVTVKDARGHPVKNAAVALVVADEAVLALTGYKTPDPVQVFYAPRAPEVRDSSLYPQIVLAEPDLNLGAAQRMALLSLPIPAPAMPAAAGLQRLRMDSAPTPVEGIRVRSDFAALALFAPSLRTDAAGQAVARFKLPDNLTRYRVMAVASASARDFGANEATLTTCLPLMVRPSAPRFLNFGDRFELPVVVQNQTDATTDVGIAVRAANAVIDDPAAKRVTLAAHDRVEVRFAAHAGKPGTARFQIGIASKNFADASEIELPVYTPATTQAFATYGEIDSDASGGGAGSAIAQPVQMPAGVFTAFGGLQISTSSTQLSALTDAFLYLLKYPYECNEQVASRILAVAALRDVLTAFKAEGMPAPQAIAASMKADLARLKRTQDPSGGWGFWSEAPWPFISTHVTYALVRAQEKGYAPDASTMTRARDYLRAIESHIPGGYPADARRAVIAYALYVRKRMGDADPARAKALIAEAGGIGKLPIEAIGWIWPTLAADKSDPGSAALDAAIRTELQNRVTETASTAHFVSGYRDADWLLLSSERRADSVLLEALIEVDPSSDLIPKLVRGLLAHRKAGRWANTQESAFVLLALERYFSAYEKTTPDFVARVWLDDQYAGQHAFKGHTSETSTINVPMQWLANKARQAPLNNAPDRQNLVIGKNGPGRLYYRIGMQYAPGQLTLAPVDNGFTVSRTYESVDHAADVQRDARGTWHIKAGARVRVQVTMVAPARRYHVALDDPLPAGLEVLNPALAVTGALPKDPNDPNDPKAIGQASRNGGPYGDWSRTWYEHQNIRDDRVQAYASQLWEGVWNYVYVARATTPGVYTAPPAKAEEMYAPETFGHSSSDRVIVE